jgi:hypothetical protein
MTNARHLFSLAILGVLVVVGARELSRLFTSSQLPLLHDYMEYWAAGRLNLDGENPYSPSRLREAQHEAGLQVDMAIMMWNPPWTLALVEPFGSLPPRPGQVLWILIQFALVLFCSDRLWLKFGGESRLRWVGWLLGVTFAPTAFLLGTGQIAGFCLLGLTGFLVFERDRPVLAGAFAALTAIKPHLLSVFALILVLQAFASGRGRRVVLGGLGVGLVAAVVPLLTNPRVYAQYLDALASPGSTDHKSLSEWKHPTLGSWLRVLIDGPFWVQLLPCLIACSLAVRYFRQSSQWDWRESLPWVVLLSLVGSPYGTWPFDLVLLLVPLIDLGVRAVGTRRRNRIGWFVAVWVLINSVLLYKLFAGVSTPYYVWVVPLWCVVVLGFRWRPQPQ